jgi:GNAT superfamily N-acetyltransferase
MNGALDLERQINAAQSILTTAAAREAARLEWALAETCRAVAEAVAERNLRLDAGVHVSAAGMAIFAGAGSPFTQGMAMGVRGSVRADELDAIEARLAPPGAGPCQIELCAFADPSLHELLAERGYRAKEWQLAWTRSVSDASLARFQPELTVCRVPRGQEELYCRVVLAGALELEDVPPAAIELILPMAFARGHELYLAWLGDEAIGGATLAVADGIAFLNGSAVRPAFRRRGAHDALIRARLDRARELGLSLSFSSTMPGTASCRNMERHGFTVAYPRIVMVTDSPISAATRRKRYAP